MSMRQQQSDNQQTESDDRGDISDRRRDKKRKRWEAKQALRQEQNAKREEHKSWIEGHSHYCTHVAPEDIQRIKSKGLKRKAGSSVTDGASLSSLEKLLRPYMDLKDGPRKNTQNQGEKLFIAEGTETVRLLIQQCFQPRREGHERISINSILVKPATFFDPPVMLLKEVEEAANHDGGRKAEVPTKTAGCADDKAKAPPFKVMVASEEALSECAGFHISRGALACGVVPQRNETDLENFLATHKRKECDGSKLRILALDAISDTANLGSMIRCAAAFGIDSMVLSDDCCDAWYRRSVRVSMGHIFNVPIFRVSDLPSTLRLMSITTYAAVVSSDADLVLEQVGRGDIPSRWCCVVGNECRCQVAQSFPLLQISVSTEPQLDCAHLFDTANGISSPVLDASSHLITIGMASGVDSLSVPIATGILLHGLVERSQTP